MSPVFLGCGIWPSDAEQSINHTRNMWTVKVTYWDHFFFCLFNFGVRGCLGSLSGNVHGLLGRVCGEQRRRGRWPCLWIPVLDATSVGCLVRLETPRGRRPTSARTYPGLAWILYVLQGGVGRIVLERYGFGTYCMGRARRRSVFIPDPVIDWHWFGR